MAAKSKSISAVAKSRLEAEVARRAKNPQESRDNDGPRLRELLMQAGESASYKETMNRLKANAAKPK